VRDVRDVRCPGDGGDVRVRAEDSKRVEGRGGGLGDRAGVVGGGG